MLTNIIIVKYNIPDYEKDCIKQVLNYTDDRKTPYHLTVYDNYEKDENLSVVWNRLIEQSNSDYILLLNNDTIVSKDWLEKLMEATKKPKFGAVGPITNCAGGHQGGFTEAQENNIIQCNQLSGFAVLFPKAVWKDLNGFDEKYKLYGEDSDFFRRMRKAGYSLFTHYGVFIYHYGQASRKEAEKRGKNIVEIRKESSARYLSHS